MASKTFVNITQEECKYYYPKIVANSNRKWEAASYIAKKGDYGTAVSLATISVEELVKALLLSFDAIGFRFRKIRGIDTVFRNHRIRHFLSYLMFLIGVVGDDFKNFFVKFENQPERLQVLLAQLKENQDAVEELVIPYILERIKLIDSERAWFAQVDVFRQNGFYSDLSDSFSDPIDISQQDYTELIRRFQMVRNACLFLMAYAKQQRKDDETTIIDLRNTFNRLNAYKRIAKLLKHVKATDKKDPFTLFASYFAPKLEEMITNGFRPTPQNTGLAAHSPNPADGRAGVQECDARGDATGRESR
jgi:AbiV family abortive infection protein